MDAYRRCEQNQLTQTQKLNSALLIGKGGEVKCNRGNGLGRGFLQEVPSCQHSEQWAGVWNTEKKRFPVPGYQKIAYFLKYTFIHDQEIHPGKRRN